MVDRLVLGCHGPGRRIIGRLADQPESVAAVVADDDDRNWAAERGVDVIDQDPEDPGALESIGARPSSVLIAADDPARIQSIADAAAVAFGPPPVFAVVPFDATGTVHNSVPDAVSVVDPSVAIAEHVLGLVGGDGGELVQRFRRTLTGLDGRLAVIMHDNPDPDAIASGTALAKIAESVGVDAVPCYFGEINHQENRALVNLLELELEQLDAETDIERFDGVALVDHGQAGVNNQLPESTPVDIVIDHHPSNGPISGSFVDLRVDAGSTSTILVEYFRRLGIDIDTSVATALLYGIRTDTDDFTRESSTADFEAAALLSQSADTSVLERVESPSVSGDTLETIARAIQNRTVRSSVVTSCVGHVSNSDTLSQAADRLLHLDGVSTSFVYGIVDETVYGSARTSDTTIDIGATLRNAFDQIGSAGGHSRMAGAQIPIGILADVEGKAELEAAIREVIDQRFYEELGEHLTPREQESAVASGTLSFLSPSRPTVGSRLSDDSSDTAERESEPHASDQ